MEFAVSAIFLLILLLPGFILQSAYTKGFWRWNSPTSARSLTEQIPAAVVLAGILHGAWTAIAARIGYPINLDAVVMLLLGTYGHDETHFDATLAALTGNPYKVFFYFLTLYSASGMLGYVSHWVVRARGWDRSTQILRFNNPWFYLLTGQITQFQESREDWDQIAGVVLTAVVHHQKEDWVYIGVIEDFFFDKSGDLDRVLLTLVQRRNLSADQELGGDIDSDDRYYHIEGDYFVLRYSEMSTMNLDYIFVTREPEPEVDSNINDRSKVELGQ
jgi:hypothetical protein